MKNEMKKRIILTALSTVISISCSSCHMRPTNRRNDFVGEWQMKVANVTPDNRALGAEEIAKNMTLTLRLDGTFDMRTPFGPPSRAKSTWSVQGDQIKLHEVDKVGFNKRTETRIQYLRINSRNRLTKVLSNAASGEKVWFERKSLTGPR